MVRKILRRRGPILEPSGSEDLEMDTGYLWSLKAVWFVEFRILRTMFLHLSWMAASAGLPPLGTQTSNCHGRILGVNCVKAIRLWGNRRGSRLMACSIVFLCTHLQSSEFYVDYVLSM